MKKIANFHLVLSLALILGSCSSIKVTSDYDREVDVSKYKTVQYYGWAENSDQILNRFDKERIEQAQVWGARDYFDALRWITGCETFYHIQDVEHFVWEQGILFTDFGKQLIKDIAKVVEYKEYA